MCLQHKRKIFLKSVHFCRHYSVKWGSEKRELNIEAAIPWEREDRACKEGTCESPLLLQTSHLMCPFFLFPFPWTRLYFWTDGAPSEVTMGRVPFVFLADLLLSLLN